ncbi:MAG: glutamate racemase [Gammaproteobacteria bacterium]|nr:glutamate racemase [Gammaproteobacteria bacterium]MCW5583554.1 glutamate racemase [Gammaproteobacteria bacterium]
MEPNHLSSQPIGIFDSGIGGLTVAHALVTSLPKENIIYFGDTAHLPYGDKSTAAIQAYAVKIAHMLLQQECKLILIACNSASAAAYELVKEYIGSKAMVMNVIDPTIHLLKEKYASKHIGLIGTKQTVNSHIYKKKIDDLNLNIQLSSHATNLLASAIEEFGNHHVIDSLLQVYLSHPELQHIDALVLACTHYPIIKNKIFQLYMMSNNRSIEIIDSSEIVALAVKKQLEENNLLNGSGTSTKHFYLSDYTESFATNAKLFFGEDITLEHYPLWD